MKASEEGPCFEAIGVECHRIEGEHIAVMADEIHIVVDPAEDFFTSSLSIFNSDKTRNKFYDKHRASYERRKIMTASPFKITPPPEVYLRLCKTSNGTTIIDVQKGTRRTAYYPPMPLSGGDIYKERSAAEAILGLDPSVDNCWVSPMALRHVTQTREEVIKAGGLFVADFDTSESGWARFRTLYICPAPAKLIYVEKWKVAQGAVECCGQHRVVPPLRLVGGRMFKKSFQPSRTEIADPVLFKSLEAILAL